MNIHPQLEHAIAALPDGIIITNKNGDIEYANSAISKISGYEPEELIGKNVRIFRSEKHSLQFYDKMWKTIQRGETWSGVIVSKKKNGTSYEEYLTIFPLKDASGFITHFVESRKNVDDAAVQEIAMEKLRKRNQKATQASYEILKDISHQVRTTMNSILGFAELLTEDIPVDKRDYLSVILNNGKHILSVIDDLLQIAKIEAGEAPIHEEKFSLNSEIATIIANVMKESLINDTTLHTIFNDAHCNVSLDKHWFSRLIHDIVINAAKHSRRKSVTIGTDKVDDHTVRIIIGDSEAWLKNNLRKDVISEFEYIDSNETRALEESGLNSIFCKSLVELMKGSISVFDSYDYGNLFILKFPVKK